MVLKFLYKNYTLRKTLIVYGITREITNSCLDYNYVVDKLKCLDDEKPQDSMFTGSVFSSLSR